MRETPKILGTNFDVVCDHSGSLASSCDLLVHFEEFVFLSLLVCLDCLV